MPETIEFIASLPDIQSALSISGAGATRVKLDIPESDLANAVRLLLLKGTAFRVTITPTGQTIKLDRVAL